MTPEERIILGQQAEVFLTSALGGYLLDLASVMSNNAVRELIKCSPSDVDGNTKWRNEIAVADLFATWLQSAVADGEITLRDMRQQEYD